MTEKVDTEAKQGFQGKVRDLGGAVRDIGGAALRETLNYLSAQFERVRRKDRERGFALRTSDQASKNPTVRRDYPA